LSFLILPRLQAGRTLVPKVQASSSFQGAAVKLSPSTSSRRVGRSRAAPVSRRTAVQTQAKVRLAGGAIVNTVRTVIITLTR